MGSMFKKPLKGKDGHLGVKQAAVASPPSLGRRTLRLQRPHVLHLLLKLAAAPPAGLQAPQGLAIVQKPSF